MNTKQIIVARRDLNMSAGKMAAQVAHASMAFLTKNMERSLEHDGWEILFSRDHYYHHNAVQDWLKLSFTKIVVYVESQEELDEIYEKAKSKNYLAYKITDNGKTEFDGVATDTCVAIGPHPSDYFEGLTDHLPLR